MLNAGFMAHRWPGISLSRCRFRRIFAAVTVYLIQLLGLRIIRLQFFVTDRPGRRDSAVMTNLSEVLLAQPKERRPIEFRVAADIIIGVWMEFFPVHVAPQFFCVVLGINVDGLRIPVVLFASDIVASFKNQYPLA